MANKMRKMDDGYINSAAMIGVSVLSETQKDDHYEIVLVVYLAGTTRTFNKTLRISDDVCEPFSECIENLIEHGWWE